MMFHKFWATVLMVFTLSACLDDDDDNEVNEETVMKTVVRVSHASPDAPAVNLLVNGDAAASDLDYSESTGLLELDEGTYIIAVEGIVPSENVTVIGPVDIGFAADTRYDVIAVNNVTEIAPYIFSAPLDFDQNNVRIAVAHLTADAPTVDVHVTMPSGDISSDTVLATLSFEDSAGPVEVTPGDYRIRVTPENSLDVIFDTGEQGIALAAGDDLFIGAIPNVNVTNSDAEKSPIALLVLTESATLTLYNANDGADFRVVHNSADAPAVDIVVNNNFESPLVEDLAFPSSTGNYVNVPADTYNVKVAAANTTTTVIDADLDLANASASTVIALNTLDSIEPLVLSDNPRKVATEARLRVVHGSTLAGNVDIYVTAVGASIDELSPAVSGFEFKADTGYIALAEGEYDITVTGAGSKQAALGPVTVTLSNNSIYTIIARDNAELNGAALTLLDAFND